MKPPTLQCYTTFDTEGREYEPLDDLGLGSLGCLGTVLLYLPY